MQDPLPLTQNQGPSPQHPYQMMPGRIFSLESHRYGFNGMEKDDEMKGAGNSYDFGARMLDPRIGRWMSVDPVSSKQPQWSTYKFGLDNPVFWIDPDGKTEYAITMVYDEETQKTIMSVKIIDDNKVMTDGVSQMGDALAPVYYNFYDFAHVTAITVHQDGSENGYSI